MKQRTTPEVGHIIREIRKQQDLPLRTLASRCGLSINAISQIERGESSPTVSTLHRLTTALGVPISSIFMETDEDLIIFIKRDDRPRHETKGLVMESLGGGLPEQRLEPFLITVEPGVDRTNASITHQGEEFVYCLEGELEYCVNDRVYPMEAGDSLIFLATQPHYWNNPSRIPAKAILVFQAGPDPHRLHSPHFLR